MKNYNANIRELILSQERKPTGCETFVYEPSNIEEESLGNLYIIGWVKSQKEDLEFLPNLIASIAKREFYKLTDTNPETSFEAALKKVNSAIHDINKEHKGLKRHVSFCIINTSKNEMRFSYVGNHMIYLLRHGSLIPLGRSEESKSIFSAVVSGEMEMQDRYLFTTSRLEELFSKKEIRKIMELDIDEQAETIERIYRDEAKEVPMPDQAALIIEIGASERPAKGFKNMINISSLSDKLRKREEKEEVHIKESVTEEDEEEERVIEYRKVDSKKSRILKIIRKKMGFVVAAIIIVIVAISASFYMKIKDASSLKAKIESQLEEAKSMPDEKRSEALNILASAQDEASTLSTYPLYKNTADNLQTEIAKATNEANGIFNIKELQGYGNISGRAFNFSPTFIFENEGKVYVFSDILNAFYKIKKDDTTGSFIFLDHEDFQIERATKVDKKIYLINYIANTVYYFDTTDETIHLITDEKELRTWMNEKPSQYEKEYNGITYSMDKNQIVKSGGIIEKQFNFLNLIRIRDFAVSDDDKTIYLLSEREVFKSDNR